MSLISEGVQFISEIYERRAQIYNLTKRDFNSKYVGSFLGFTWAFLEPLALTLLIWAVFGLGFRVNPSGDVPFVVYLIPGMAAFNFFSATIGASSNVIMSFSFLVKKVKFRVAILPIIKISSALIIHTIFMMVVLVIICANGIWPSFYWFQVIYYTFSLLFFMLGLSWLLSAIGVFVRDISHVIQILLTFGFWMTPIFWNISMIPEKYRILLWLNPMFYIVQGYRDSLIYKIPFWEHPAHMAFYWVASSVMLLVGILVFKKLRPHFADVI